MTDHSLEQILARRKTMTRRVIEGEFPKDVEKPFRVAQSNVWCFPANSGGHNYACRWGIPGDQLWVQEVHAFVEYAKDHGGGSESQNTTVVYRADGYNQINKDRGERWRPCRFMPRRYSRILLELEDVIVERVQDISEEDAIAEGVFNAGGVCGYNEDGTCKFGFSSMGVGTFPTAKEGYKFMWDVINRQRDDGIYAWDKN